MKRNYFYGLMIAGMVLMLSACSSKDAYDSGLVQQNTRETYASNFVKKYGEIDPNQTWDFSKGVRLGTRGESDEVQISVEFVDGLDFGLVDEVVDGA